jgi:hypothetical protein
MKPDAHVVSIPVTFVRRSGDYDFRTEVVTHRGIFARMKNAPRLMSYEKMLFKLPLHGAGVMLQGVVTRLIDPTYDQPLWGVAIAFYGKGGDAAMKWDTYVDSLQPTMRPPEPDADPGTLRLEFSQRVSVDIPVIRPSSQRRAALGIPSIRPQATSTAITIPARPMFFFDTLRPGT